MVQRGRKSRAKLEAQTVLQLIPGQVPPPPDYLTPDQAAIWVDVARTKPADWFTSDTFPLLASYCRHVATANLIAAQIDLVEKSPASDKLLAYAKLLKLRKDESYALIALASSLRISQSARARAPETKGAGVAASKPWDLE